MLSSTEASQERVQRSKIDAIKYGRKSESAVTVDDGISKSRTEENKLVKPIFHKRKQKVLDIDKQGQIR